MATGSARHGYCFLNVDTSEVPTHQDKRNVLTSRHSFQSAIPDHGYLTQPALPPLALVLLGYVFRGIHAATTRIIDPLSGMHRWPALTPPSLLPLPSTRLCDMKESRTLTASEGVLMHNPPPILFCHIG